MSSRAPKKWKPSGKGVTAGAVARYLNGKRKVAAAVKDPPADETPSNPRPSKKLKMRKGGVEIKPRKSLLSMVLSSATSFKALTAKTPSESPNHLEMLPDEVLGKIFFSGFVNSIDIITNVTMVSKRTRRVANKSVKMLDLRALPKLEASHVAAIVSRHGHVSSLDFGYCPQFGRDHLMALVPVSETLRSLCLRGSCLRDDDIVAYLDAVVEHLGGRASGLEELDLSAIKKEENPRIGDMAVSKIVQCCPQLKTLQLGWCKGVTNKCLPELKNLRRLKDLDLSLTSITEEGCKDISKIYELEKLDLTATGLGDEGMKDLLVEDPKRLVRLRLKFLKVGFNSDMTENSLKLLATHVPSLKTLDIRYCELDKNDAKDSFQMLKRNGTEITGGG